MSDNTDASEIVHAIREARTQYNTGKVAQQETSWSVDPSKPLSKQNTSWWSNGTRFDSSLFTEADGETQINLTATGTDSARICSAYIGRYVSHCLSEPGVGISIADANVQYDPNNEISLDHGLIQFGPFFHDGTQITDGFGFEIDANGLRFVVKSGGSHKGNSPIEQSEFNLNKLNKDGERLELETQSLANFPYGFYNALPLTGGFVRAGDKSEKRNVRERTVHSEYPQLAPLLAYPNLPVQVYASNEGTATALDLGIGGMQYARYGKEDPSFRTTTDYRQTTGGTFTSSTAGLPDPQNTPGDAFFAYRRETGAKDLTMKDKEVIIDPTADVFVYFWDEWDPATALDGTFSEPTGVTYSGETLIETSTDSTTYTPTISNFRGSRRVVAGQKNEIDPTSQDVSDRVPKGATRVWTLSIRDGSADTDLNYLEAEMEEAF